VLQVDQKSRLYNAGRPAKQGISPALPWPTSRTPGETRQGPRAAGNSHLAVWRHAMAVETVWSGLLGAPQRIPIWRGRRRAGSQRTADTLSHQWCLLLDPLPTEPGSGCPSGSVRKNLRRHGRAEERRFAPQPIATCGPAGQCRAALVRLRPKW